MSPESVADLVDLEQELSSIQRGITQMERITPNDPPSKHSTEDDPFGDSFTQFPVNRSEEHSMKSDNYISILIHRPTIYCLRPSQRNHAIRSH